MTVLAQAAAVALYLAPIAVVLALYARRDRTLWHLAASIPATVAADLIGTLLLCRILRLEVAAFASRAFWLAGGAWFAVKRRRRGGAFERPAAIDRRALVALGLAALLGAALSATLSRPFAIWDRELHIPVVAALRGQRLPFSSAYEPGVGFHYHFTGDVLAAMLQTYSFDVLNSSLALSLAHDVMFVLIAVATGLGMLSRRRRPPHVVVLGVAAVLLSGPCVLRFGVGEPYLGYSYYALYIWGFRPHQHIAMLMLVGIAIVLLARGDQRDRGAVAAESRPAQGAGWAGIGSLALMMLLLPVTDETSAAVLGLCLGLAWIFDPELLAPTRRGGAVLLGVLALAFVATNLLFEASLSRGSPVQKLAFVAPRSPGVQQPPLPLTGVAGWVALVADTLPIWAILMAVVAAGRGGAAAPERPTRGLLVFLCALFAVSVFGLTSVEMNGAPPESHRFLTAALFLFPVFGVLASDWWPPETARRSLVLGALTLGGFSTLLWLSHYPRHPTPERYFQQRGQNLHATDCRTLAGARLGETPAVRYVESSVFYSYVGCRPSYVPGHRESYWLLKLRPTVGLAGLKQLDREMVKPEAPVDAICPAGRSASDVDPVCAYALTRRSCAPEGTAFLRCALSPADRRTLLGPATTVRLHP